MKKKVLLLMGIFSIGLLHAQVGINTTNPQGVFHVDAKNNTNGNLNTTDDVIVTKNGNIGIGTINPQTKVHLYKTNAGAIRMEDGNAGAGRAMLSDNSGVARWSPIPGGWYAILSDGASYTTGMGYAKITFSSAVLSQAGVGSTDAPNGKITVPYTGKYRITIVGLSGTDMVTNTYYVAWLSLAINGTEIWAPHIMGHTSNGALSFGFSTVLSLNYTDKVSVANHMGGTAIANSLANVIYTVEYLM